MKNVRLLFTKKGRLRFISHLDMNRFMSRVIKKAMLPIWYTEGFNPHPYITFALPLSLGFESDYEILDIRITDDSYDISSIPNTLNEICGEYITFFDSFEPVLKCGLISSASYEVTFDDQGKIFEQLQEFLNQSQIICSKKTKKGDIKQLDIAPKIKDLNVEIKGDTVLTLTLPAGGEENLNPELLITAFYEKHNQSYYCYRVLRTAIYDGAHNKFR